MKKITSKHIAISAYIIFSVAITIFFAHIAYEYRGKAAVGGELAFIFFMPVGVSLILGHAKKTRKKGQAAKLAHVEPHQLQDVEMYYQAGKNY
jgi:hypothetical protein